MYARLHDVKVGTSSGLTEVVMDPPTGALTLQRIGKHVYDIFTSRAFWRSFAFMCIVLFVSLQWRHMDNLLPPFLERHYGDGVPIYRIHSINSWGCVIGPPLVAAVTGNRETFLHGSTFD